MTTHLGTYPYMAPELFSAKENAYDYKVDVWSLGVMYHQLLTGQLYFMGQSHFDIRENIVNKPYQPPNIDISEESKDILKKMLQKNPKDRIDTIELLSHPLFEKFMEDILSSLNTFKSSIFGHAPMKSVVTNNDSSVIVSEVNQNQDNSIV